MKKAIKKQITIPEDTTIQLELPKIIVKSSLGTVERNFKFGKNIKLKQQNNLLVIECAVATKKEKALLNCIATHIMNMIKGVKEGFEYKLEVCSIHFPITVRADKEKNLLFIKNFLGETKERTAKLLPNVDISIQDNIITLKGIDIEKVAQCAANIEKSTRVKTRDRRVYQDGVWIISKAGKEIR